MNEVLKLRKKLKLTQEQMALSLGISQSTLCKYEQNKMAVGLMLAKALRKKYRVNINKWIDREII